MKNIFRFMAEAKGAVLAITLLLIVQAWCDLSIPSLTSDLLNVGLQQNGIEDAVPDTIRAERLEMLALFLSEEDTLTLQDAYLAENEEGLRTLREMESKEREELNRLLRLPESVIFQMESSEEGQEILSKVQSAVSMGMLTKEQLLSQMQQRLSSLEGMNEEFLDQIAVEYVSQEYEAIGMDMNAIRNSYLWKVGTKMLLVALLMAAVAIVTGFLAAKVSAGISRNLRERLFKKVMEFTSAEIEEFSTASLITRCTNDIQQVQMLIVILLRMVAYAPILAIAGVIKVIQTGSSMSWTIVLAVIALAVCIAILFFVAYPKFLIMQKLVDRLNLVSRELLTGVMPIRAFERQKHEEERFAKANKDLFSTQLFTDRTMNLMMPVMMLIMNAVSVLIVWVGGHGVDTGTVQVGDLTAFVTYSMVIITGFLMVSVVSILLPRAGIAADRVEEVLGMEISLKDAPQTMDAKLQRPAGVLNFADVSFRYPGAEEPVLEHISFTAEPGKTTAIIGSTGCGKSTLLHLITRFYDVSEGSITLDGIDIRQLSQKKLRDCIGYVPQKGILFSGTVESNLKYAGDEVTDEDMKKAAAIAQATEFIEAKEEGFQSPIAQNGSNVSGGQRQRLSIARAIAKHPQIFLFDDTFSALDYKTDAALRAALSREVRDATVLIVAQRVSTILHADQILVMEDGRIVGKGTHRELLESCQTYLEIARGQLSEAEIAGALKGGNANG